MKIQPIVNYRSNVYSNRNVKRADEPVNQPNFKGMKGLLKGLAVGAGGTAAGVAMIAGAAALPVFLSYIAVNGAIAGFCGHMIENRNKENKN